MSSSAHPPLILLVGMHRSGTSLLGSLLPALGVPLPGDLIAADPHNPEGYYERADLTALQEQLLISLGQWWPAEAGVMELTEGWLGFPAVRRCAASLTRLLAEEQRCQPGPWALKDPRTSLLLPLWRQVAAELDQPLKLVLSVRDPAEVMVSLLQRDRLAAGMTAWRAQRLWWRHHQALLNGGDNLPLLVVDYAAWFEPTACRRQLEALARFCRCSEPSQETLDAAAARIRPAHRRSRRAAAELPLPIHPELCRLHQHLRTLAHLDRSRSDAKTREPGELKLWLNDPRPRPLPACPPFRSGLRARLLRRRAALVPCPDPGPWFDPGHYRRRSPGLSSDHEPLEHYSWRGWREGRSVHPLFDTAFYLQACRERGLTVAGAPLFHFLQVGLAAELPPCPVAEPRWLAGTPQRQALWRTARLEGLHPWGAAALALSDQDPEQAVARILQWQRQGFSAEELEAIAAAAPESFLLPEALLNDPPPIPRRCRVLVPDGDLLDWQVHAWLQHLPLPPGFDCLDGETAATTAGDDDGALALLLEPLPPGAASLQLLGLALLPWVFARSDLVPLLRRLGVNARPIEPQGNANGWLSQDGMAAEACLQLGLPPAEALAAEPLAAEAPILTLGSAGASWERELQPPLWGWPEFEAVAIAGVQQARLLASWLQGCNRAGLQLVRLTPPEAERRLRGWQALSPPADPRTGWLPPQAFTAPLSAAELVKELVWRAQGALPPPPVITPEPRARSLWEQQMAEPTAAVCISLHNYAERIVTALESVRAQSHGHLELIVVDDASADGGEERVRVWLDQHGHRFARTLLLRHDQNGGLAAARNTAFRWARSPWCFVLDADNLLQPEAVATCLAVGNASPSAVAVVHPLVEVVDETGAAASPSTLISGLSWQRTHFRQRNVVDAMALVRRSSWEAVGGYEHIPGGWEDYDFWCKLMEAGHQGVLAPQVLATYHRHGASMLATSTHRHLRAVSRQLQQRHPWLELPLAAGLQEGWT
ncbi:glycosyltransferase [Synechococcus sp. CS-1328]|uniref:glycosyltransferase n=1 Tax=Synechococcus sp. CS-1328 TaxID=2847976 RepID=UPI00223BAE7D|nr:glycosyltransferase [Synechococcus sp. CS-1328]MCT0224975.1 glycosyltransferase [Synechococcus sp. CS-1328]